MCKATFIREHLHRKNNEKPKEIFFTLKLE
jgi:hypothetical protein